MTVLFEFEGETTPKDRKKTVAKIQSEGARHVKRMFPREKNPRLANLHSVEVDDEKAEEIVRILNDDTHVGYAEIPPERSI